MASERPGATDMKLDKREVMAALLPAALLALAALATRPALFPELTDVAGPPAPSGRPLTGDAEPAADGAAAAPSAS